MEPEATPDLASSDEYPAAVVAVPDPASFADGRYVVRRFLGEGGKKRVFLAHDALLDRDVAFALIKVEGSDDLARVRVVREAQAMGRLGSHPHVVTVFDLGEADGQPFMVTELMDGGDVEGMIASAAGQGQRVPLERAVEIARAVCRGLEFAHSKGLVHRDLKPGNVWLTSDGVAKVGDFGLALALDESRLTQEGTIVGTVAYMPPEQAFSGAVGPRSDLYSLGAMLYELVTGRQPFLGDDPVSIISQHINTPPIAPCWHNRGCPKLLEALILRLLAKDPSERPGSASEVFAALEAIDVAQEAAEDSPIREERGLEGLAAGVFVGRQLEMGELKAALEDALSGHGRLVMLVGEPGIGKTRTALELATYAGLRQVQVVWGRCYEGEGAPPYWPWVQAIRSYAREHEPEQLRAEMGSGAAEIAEVVGDLRQRLPGLERPPDQGDPRQARFRLFDSIATFLKSAAHSQPLVLVLDDLHWADAGSLLLLEFVAHEMADARLLLVGTYRDVELSRRHPLSLTLGELRREQLFTRVLLRGLSPEDVGRFIEATSGVVPPDQLVGTVYDQTEGNPLFVSEVVRLLVQEGELASERLAEREHWSVRIPEGVREVIGRRLDRLSDRCNEALTVAAVLGREFTLAHLVGLCDDLSRERLLDLLEEALAARVIEEAPDAKGYQFSHALIQETLAAELSSASRVRLHASVAEALESLYSESLELHAGELAYHYAEAEPILGPEKLVRYSILAGERALAARAYEEAAVQFRRGLRAQQGTSDVDTAALLFGLGRAQLATVEWTEFPKAIEQVVRAFELYADAGESERAVTVATHPLPPSFGLGETQATQMIARALRLAPSQSGEAGHLLAFYGWLLGVIENDREGAQEAFSRALAIAHRSDDGALERRAVANAAHVEWLNEHWDACLEYGGRATELSLRAKDPGNEMSARSWVARTHALLGSLDEARREAAATLARAEEMREGWWLATARGNSMLVAMLEGDWASARELSDAGLSAAPWDPRLISLRLQLEAELGESDEVRTLVDCLVDVMGKSPPPGLTAEHAFAAAFVPLATRVSGVGLGLEEAERAAERVLALRTVVPAVVTLTNTGLALLAAEREDEGVAAKLAGAFQPGRLIPFMAISADRLLGLVAVTLGNIEAASKHFERALAFCRRAGYRPELAWVASDYADTLKARCAPGDAEQAAALWRDALSIARELGMRPLMERALSERPLLDA